MCPLPDEDNGGVTVLQFDGCFGDLKVNARREKPGQNHFDSISSCSAGDLDGPGVGHLHTWNK